MASAVHEYAVRRLEASLREQDRLGDRYAAAIGTSSEIGAYERLRAAGARVAADDAWLHWVDDETCAWLNGREFGGAEVAPAVFAWRTGPRRA
jgi:hypothetical protein